MTEFAPRKPGFRRESRRPAKAAGAPPAPIPAGPGGHGIPAVPAGAQPPSRYPHGMRSETARREAES